MGRFRHWSLDFTRVPALPVALAMIGGVALSRAAPVHPWWWLAVATALLSLLLLRPSRGTSLILLFCVMIASTALAQRVGYYFARDHITHFAIDTPRLCQLRLYLPNEPRLRTMTFGQRFPVPPRQVTLARVTGVKTWNGWIDASGEVLVQVREPNPLLAAGQTVQVIGLLERPGIAMNPGQFDWQRYYREMGVLCSVQVPHADNIRILNDAPPPLLTRLRESARRALALGFEPEDSLDHALLGALVLGDYDPELRDVRDQFRKTGTSHHLAISGMHVAIVGGMVFLILRLVRLGPRTCWLATMAVVAFYGILATPSPPVWRSVILFLTIGAAILCVRFSRVLQLLAVTVVVMLVLHPLDLLNAGFQLSFLTVLGLILLSEPMTTRFTNELDLLRPNELVLRPRGERVRRWIDRRGMLVICASVVAWLVSMPLVALHFTQLNPWAVPASIALAPFVVVALCAGVAKITLTWLVPSCAGPLAEIAGSASGAMRWCVEHLARMPAGDVPLTSPAWWVVAACWLAIAALVVRWRMGTMRLASWVFIFLAFGYLIAGPYVLGASNALRAGQVRITLMAVGAGQVALIEPAGGRVVLMDCGSNSLTDLNANVVVPVLRERGHTAIDTIFISHANTDHYSGVVEIADAYGVREIVVGEAFEKSARETPTGSALLRDLDAIDLPPRIARPGDRIPLGRDCFVGVLWPDRSGGLEANDMSLVTRLVVGNRSILFTGDIQTDGMKGLLESGAVLSSDVLVAMHHGSGEDITAEFVERVAPTWIVSSNDRTLSGKQRRFDELMAGRRSLRTHEYGAITILIDADGTVRLDGFVKDPN